MLRSTTQTVKLLLCFLLYGSEAWVLPASSSNTRTPRTRQRPLYTAQQQQDITSPVGCRDFEAWCKQQGADINPNISHALFPGSVRGLTWTDGPPPKTPVLRVPDRLVLSSTFDKNPNWDADLACILWREIEKGDDSAVSGYCDWLGKNPTAPDALRHWTESQKEELLSREPAGQALLDLASQQEVSWRKKYEQVAAKSMTWDQFEWAMEAVHSRAFCGIATAKDSTLWLKLAAPIAAAAAGYYYTMEVDPLANDLSVLVVLGVLSLVPALFLQPTSSAVLLPLIDSANHLEQADSNILYDPVGKTFDLTIGPVCIVDEEEASQLYISYGRKGASELLLNYGFLNGVDLDGTVDERRRRLAQAFLERSKSA